MGVGKLQEIRVRTFFGRFDNSVIKGTLYLEDLAEHFIVKSIELGNLGRGVHLRFTPIQEDGHDNL